MRNGRFKVAVQGGLATRRGAAPPQSAEARQGADFDPIKGALIGSGFEDLPADAQGVFRTMACG
jgi:hypothetical protein